MIRLGGPPKDLTPDYHRRTVYGSVSRYKLDAYLQLFDFPPPNISAEKRFTTTVPLQRLFLMNSDFMQLESEALDKRVAAEPNNAARIRKLYNLVYGRDPKEAEVQIALEYLRTEPMKEYEESKTRATEKEKEKEKEDSQAATPPTADAKSAGPKTSNAAAVTDPPADGPNAEMGMGMMGGVPGTARDPRDPWRLSTNQPSGAATPSSCSVPQNSFLSTEGHNICPVTNLRAQSLAERALRSVGNGFGMMAFAGMLGESLLRAGLDDKGLGVARLDYPQRVKRVIFLFMNGGLSTIDAFDPKPMLGQIRRPADARRFDIYRAPHRRADEVAVQIQEIWPVRHGRQRTLAAS